MSKIKIGAPCFFKERKKKNMKLNKMTPAVAPNILALRKKIQEVIELVNLIVTVCDRTGGTANRVPPASYHCLTSATQSYVITVFSQRG